jgi:hypothetical protein
MNEDTLKTELQSHGTIRECRQNNSRSYIVALDNVTAEESVILQITNNHISQEYPRLEHHVLENGSFKCIYFND